MSHSSQSGAQRQKPKPPGSSVSKPRTGPLLDAASRDGHPRFSSKLLSWFRKNQRPLPWRSHPEPYAVWVSEVMLQQTQVSTVLPYFKRWMRRFPTLEDLAAAEEDQVLQYWQGLGYYSRARSLMKGARAVVSEHGGRIPSDVKVLQGLPGIGAYTAGAIASIAYEQDAPIVDGNVIRVLTRSFALGGEPTRQPLKQQLWDLAEQLIPKGQGRAFNQALMELGALVCTPRSPLCDSCPIRAECRGRSEGAVMKYPEKKARPKTTRLQHTALLLRRAGRVLVRQNPEDAPRWPSMWMFPTYEQQQGESAEATAAKARGELLSTLKPLEYARVRYSLTHAVTRYRIELSLVEVDVPRGARILSGSWRSLDSLTELAMPAAHRKLAEWLSSQENK